MTHLCGCGRPSRDATLCAACGFEVDAALAEIVAYHGLGWDLDIATARRTQPRMTAQEIAEEKIAPGVLAPIPLPYNPRASEAAAALKHTLASWAKLVAEETGAALPHDGVTAIATWLRPWTGWLRHHPAGAEAHDEILDAVRQARRTTDRPSERLYAGVCDCGAHLYARPGSLTVVCRNTEHGEPVVWPMEDRRAQLLAALDDHLANATQMSRLLTYLGITLAPSSIRMYAHKGRVGAHGRDQNKHPLYRLGDVVRTYYDAAPRSS